MMESKNFSMDLGDGDQYCLCQVMTKEEFPQIVNDIEFIKEVSDFALRLAEKNLKHEKEKQEIQEKTEKYYEEKMKEKIQITKGKKGLTEITFKKWV